MITVHDDKKEKYQSWEAYLHLADLPTIKKYDYVVNHVTFDGYGKDKEEAIKNLKEQFEVVKKFINSVDFDSLLVVEK